MPLYQVALPTPLFRTFTYESLSPLPIGQFVLVPLRSTLTVGIIVNEETTYKGTVKEIEEILPWTLNTNHIQFLEWLSQYTISPFGLCMKLMLPFPLKEIQKMVKSSNLLKNETSEINSSKKIILTEDQKQAVTSILEKQETFTPFLLDGMTGSGKTEVYFDIIEEILKKKQQALVLLPEIALTKQWVDRFLERFGFHPFLWHSQVPLKTKRMVFESVYQGLPCVVVGARSALFLPFQNLKLIVVDEEHDGSYKQEEQLLYHARDAAIMRAKIEKCPIILSSATPSLETFYNAKINKYQPLTLNNRYGVKELPPIHLIDRRQKSETKKGKYLSPTLINAIKENLLKKEQTLLFVNRRGFAPLTLCEACGHRFDCKGCTAWLTHHEKTKTLKCHHCNHEEAYPTFCPECGTKDQFVSCGPGVERLLEETVHLFPNARILVVSSDMMTSLKQMKEMIDQILENKVDIIIGTQLMAKGHHFPNLTLIGIVDADIGLTGMDLRAVEKTFQLLFQVAGRAGRESLKGKIYLQTYQPDHPVMQSLKDYDKQAFLEAELAQREMFHMPPFSKLMSITLQSRSKTDLHQAAYKLTKSKPQNEDIQILGPTPPPLAQVRGQFRERFLVITEKPINRQAFMNNWVFKTSLPKSVRVIVDVDPLSFG